MSPLSKAASYEVSQSRFFQSLALQKRSALPSGCPAPKLPVANANGTRQCPSPLQRCAATAMLAARSGWLSGVAICIQIAGKEKGRLCCFGCTFRRAMHRSQFENKTEQIHDKCSIWSTFTDPSAVLVRSKFVHPSALDCFYSCHGNHIAQLLPEQNGGCSAIGKQ